MFRYANPAIFMRLSGALLPWVSRAAADRAGAPGSFWDSACRPITSRA